MAAGQALSSYPIPEPAEAERTVHALSPAPEPSLDTQRARTPDRGSRSAAVLAGPHLEVRQPAVPLQGGSPGRAAGRALTSGAHRAERGERAAGRPLCGSASPSPTSSVPGDPRVRLGRPPPACPGEAVAASE